MRFQNTLAPNKLVLGCLYLAFALSFLAPCLGQTHRPENERALDIESLIRARPLHTSGASAAPDGSALAMTLCDRHRMRAGSSFDYSSNGVPLSSVGCDVFVSETSTKRLIDITQALGSSWGAVWSPDGKQLAFFSDRDGKPQLWIWMRETKDIKRVSELPVHSSLYSMSSTWSFDGSYLIAPFKSADGAVPLDPQAAAFSVPDDKYPGSTPRLISNSPHPTLGSTSQDAVLPTVTSRNITDLGVVNAKNGQLKWIARRVAVRWYAFRPSSHDVGYAVIKGSVGGRPGWGDIHDLFVASGESSKIIASSVRLGVPDPAWSPNGRYLACADTTIGQILVVDTTMGGVRSLSSSPASVVGSVSRLLWNAGSDTLLFASNGALWKADILREEIIRAAEIPDHHISILIPYEENARAWAPISPTSIGVVAVDKKIPRHGIYLVDYQTGVTTRLREQEESFFYTSRKPLQFALRNGEAVIVPIERTNRPRNYWAIRADGQARQITDLYPKLNDLPPSRTRLLTWTTEDGKRTLHGGVILPPSYVDGQRVPMIVVIYGGVDLAFDINGFGASPYSFAGNLELYATRGYAVLLAGSSASPPDVAKDVFESAMPGVQAAIDSGVADPERVGIIGGSFGGFCTLAMITQSTQFRAAVIEAGFAGYLSLYGAMLDDGSAPGTGISESSAPGGVGGTPWQFPERYTRNNLLLSLDKVQTPLLIFHGREDKNVPYYAGREVFVALRRLDREVKYVEYDGEAHAFSRFENVVDKLIRSVSWFDEHLKKPADNGAEKR